MRLRRLALGALRPSTITSLVITVILLVAFPALTRAQEEPPPGTDPGRAGDPSAEGLLPRVLASSRPEADDLLFNSGCPPPAGLDQATLNKLLVMSILERQIMSRSAFSSLLRTYPRRDRDHDGFGPETASPGRAFRGRDCDDQDPDVHPMLGGNTGGTSPDVGVELDYNCDGISGTDPGTGLTYDDTFCTQFEDDRGLIVFGDSWASGFGMDADCLTSQTPGCLFKDAGAVFNHPEISYLTGYAGSSSLYLDMRRRNRCAHRQWMSFARPGAKMRDFADQVREVDLPHSLYPAKPSIVVVQFAEGDVCADTLLGMTRAPDFLDQLLEGLGELDIRIGNGSRVILMGLGNGKQYDLMHNATHPVFSQGPGNGTYSDVYEYWTCLGLNPCPLRLSSDYNVRNAATQRSLEIDGVLAYVSTHYSWANFTSVFLGTDDVVNRAVENWVGDGKDAELFFSGFDGFHPAFPAFPYLGHALLSVMAERYPGYLGLTNPGNAEIDSLFGDQGGY